MVNVAVIQRFIKYGFVQVVAYGIDLGTFYVCAELLLLSLLVSNLAGKLGSGVFAFFVHRHFTFQPSWRGLASEARRYTMLAVFNALLSSGLIYLFNLFLPVIWAKIAGDVVCVGLTFLLVQKIVFPASANPQMEESTTL